MPFFRRDRSTSLSEQPPKERLSEATPSQVVNVLARELNTVLPDELIAHVRRETKAITSTTAQQEVCRGLMALNWFTREWIPAWSLLIPEAGQQLASTLAASPLIEDSDSATAVGQLVLALAATPGTAEKTVAINYDKDNFFDMAAVTAARSASVEALAKSAGSGVIDCAASVVLDECMAARTDVALAAGSSIALLHSLDGVWPYIQQWANGPGNMDAKRISISNLAPYAAGQALEPTVKSLQEDVCTLYVNMCNVA